MQKGGLSNFWKLGTLAHLQNPNGYRLLSPDLKDQSDILTKLSGELVHRIGGVQTINLNLSGQF